MNDASLEGGTYNKQHGALALLSDWGAGCKRKVWGGEGGIVVGTRFYCHS